MSGRLLLDTNIILGFLKGQKPVVEFLEKHDGSDLCASVITRLELLSFHGLMKEEERTIQDFLDAIAIIPLNADIEDAAIRLRRATRRKLPDAIVAASAMISGATLVTRDRELEATEFPGLTAINPDTSAIADKS